MSSNNLQTWVEISKSAIRHNLRQFLKITQKRAKIAPVLKANAYGHGLVECAYLLKNTPIWGICLVNLSEALILRNFGYLGRILVLSFADEDLYLALNKDITFSIYRLNFAKKLNNLAAKRKKRVKVHIKLDVGTNRLGIRVEEVVSFVKKLKSLKNLEIEGLFSHFADSESQDWRFTRFQIKKFNQAIKLLEKEGINIPLKHIACSAAAISSEETHYNLIRPGLSIYGLWPSPATRSKASRHFKNFTLKPALSWYTKIIQIKDVPAGSFVGYGRTYRTYKKTKIAVLPVGYWDGYDRRLSNKSFVLIKGRRCPVIGRVCMNMFMVDVSQLPQVRVGDKVTLIGQQGKEEITADELAALIGTINYEVTTRINPLIPRIYV